MSATSPSIEAARAMGAKGSQMTTIKRYRRREAKPGQLIVYYGKLPHSDPDICYAWGGNGADKRDGNFLAYVLGSKRVTPVYGQERINNGGQHFIFENSVFEELEARGYDLTTLRFSIQKKVSADDSL